jgi:hypothetical protein
MRSSVVVDPQSTNSLVGTCIAGSLESIVTPISDMFVQQGHPPTCEINNLADNAFGVNAGGAILNAIN